MPSGEAAVGWRVGVYWRVDQVFYTGELLSYDAVAGRHEVLYDDGEVRQYMRLVQCSASVLTSCAEPSVIIISVSPQASYCLCALNRKAT